jgi:three-Cys-motif partner protein
VTLPGLGGTMKRHKPLDLHAVKHSTCQKCGADLRDENLEEGICAKIVSAVDGEPVRCVGPWVYDKIHFLTRYFGIFGPGMHKLWQGNIHYIEVCSGPGRCINRDTTEEIDGTSLAVINHDAYASYKTVTFFDKSPSVVMALNKRIKTLRQDGKSVACKADYTKPTDLVDICVKRAPLGLSLIFLDPTDCSVPMDTVRRLSRSLRNADFIINVATGTDANRNLKTAFAKPDGPARQKYETFLGSSAFFINPENIRLAETNQDDRLRAQFRIAYQSALTEEGYQYFEVELVRHYYDLVFASKHPTGLKFWRQAQRIRPDNQDTFDFGM